MVWNIVNFQWLWAVFATRGRTEGKELVDCVAMVETEFDGGFAIVRWVAELKSEYRGFKQF